MRRTQAVGALSLSAALALAVLAGCSSGKITTSPVSTASPPAVSAPASPAAGATSTSATATTAPVSAQVGDTLNLSGNDTGSLMAVTVTRVVDPAAAANVFGSPSPGNRLVAVQFQLKNVGTAVYSDSPSNGAQLIDSRGQIYNSFIGDTNAGPSLPSIAHIAPGDTALGYITFQVPLGTSVAKVQFTLSSGFARDTGQWIVNQSVAGSAPPASQPAAAGTATGGAAGTAAAGDPRQVVETYYADINSHDYNGAWALGERTSTTPSRSSPQVSPAPSRTL